MGCWAEITRERNNLISTVPDIITFAVGVGTDVNRFTIDKISGSTTNSFYETSFQSLLVYKTYIHMYIHI